MTGKRYFSRFFKSQWVNACGLWILAAVLFFTVAQFFLPSADNTAARLETQNISEFYKNVFEPFFQPNGNGRIQSRNKNLIPQTFSLKKDKNTQRIFIVGGSVARNLGLSSHMDKFKNSLARLYPGKNVECINAAIAGYDSFRVRRVVNEIINYSPDCLIILSGNNEFYPKALTNTDRLLYHLRKIKLLNLCMPKPRDNYTARSVREKLTDYKNNLSKMLETAQSRGIQTILCTVPINSRDFAPYGQFPSDKKYIKAAMAFWNKNFESAASKAEVYKNQNANNAHAYYLSGQISMAQGFQKQADSFFNTALNLDYGTNTRTSPDANAVVRSTAKEHKAALADIQKQITALNKKGILDRHIFTDICHLRETARPIIFNTILKTLSLSAQVLPIELGDITAEPMGKQFAWFASDCINSPDTFLSGQSFSKFKLVYLSHGIHTVKKYLSNKQLLLNNIKNFTEVKTKPDWSIIYLNTGEALRRLGQSAAALEYLNKAKDSGLKTAPLYISLALIMHSQDNKDKALQYINTAINYAQQNSRPIAESVREIILNPEK